MWHLLQLKLLGIHVRAGISCGAAALILRTKERPLVSDDISPVKLVGTLGVDNIVELLAICQFRSHLNLIAWLYNISASVQPALVCLQTTSTLKLHTHTADRTSLHSVEICLLLSVARSGSSWLKATRPLSYAGSSITSPPLSCAVMRSLAPMAKPSCSSHRPLRRRCGTGWSPPWPWAPG